MTPIIITDSAFGETQKATLRCLAALMIPVEDALPSAADPAIFADILVRLGERPDVASEGLARIDSIGAGRAFPSLSQAEQHTVVARLRVECPAFVTLFESSVAACYYRDDRVLRSLGLPARAPYPEGNAVEPTDWSMLDPVRARQPFYRSV